MQQFIDLFTTSTTGLIDVATTGAVDILTMVLPYLVGFILVRFAVKWIRKGINS